MLGAVLWTHCCVCQLNHRPRLDWPPLCPADINLPPSAMIRSLLQVDWRAPPLCPFSWLLVIFMLISGAGQCRCVKDQSVVKGPAGRLFSDHPVPTLSLGINPERWFIVVKFICEKPLIPHSECVACWHALSAWIIIPIHVRASAGGIHLLLSNSQSSQHASLWSKFSSPLLWTAFENGEIIAWAYGAHFYSMYLHNQGQLNIFIDNLLLWYIISLLHSSIFMHHFSHDTRDFNCPVHMNPTKHCIKANIL